MVRWHVPLLGAVLLGQASIGLCGSDIFVKDDYWPEPDRKHKSRKCYSGKGKKDNCKEVGVRPPNQQPPDGSGGIPYTHAPTESTPSMPSPSMPSTPPSGGENPAPSPSMPSTPPPNGGENPAPSPTLPTTPPPNGGENPAPSPSTPTTPPPNGGENPAPSPSMPSTPPPNGGENPAPSPSTPSTPPPNGGENPAPSPSTPSTPPPNGGENPAPSPSTPSTPPPNGGENPAPSPSMPSTPPPNGGENPAPSPSTPTTPPPNGGENPAPSPSTPTTPPPNGGENPAPSPSTPSTPPPNGGENPAPSPSMPSTPPPNGGENPAPSPTLPTTPPPNGGENPAPSPSLPTTPPPNGGENPAPSPSMPSTPPPDGGESPAPSNPAPSPSEPGEPSLPPVDGQVCRAVDGRFGSTQGIPAAVTFAYEVEVDPAEISDTVSEEVLPALEQVMVEFLLPELFPDECGGTVIVTARLGAGRRRRLEVVGVDSFPVDRVSADLVCEELEVATNECSFVDGSLTINYVLRGNETLQGFVNQVLARLRLGMDTDEFLVAHPSIERVTFVDGSGGPSLIPTAAPTPIDQDGRPIVDDDDDTIEWWIWLLIGAGLFTACSGLLVYYQRNNAADVGRSGRSIPDASSLVNSGADGAFPDE